MHKREALPAISPNMYRTHTCGELSAVQDGEEVRLAGWVHARRDHGGLIFIDLRDKWGITQLTFNPDKQKEAWEAAEGLRSEFVIAVTGKVIRRPQEMVNKKISTGEIEVEVAAMRIISSAQTTPFEITSSDEINEELRLQYRYLDLRRERMRKNMELRHQMLQHIRQFFYTRNFIEIETPMLIKNTPEGAREYVVPSRVHPGHFYVLPQSPQQLKQLSMVAGFDRYMQIARCFRDEDQRGDRQPEFTQVDIEMSFATPEDVMTLTEECLVDLTKSLRADIAIKETPFPRLTWEQAIGTYGSDKPDLRFTLGFVDVGDLCRGSGFTVFAKAVDDGGVVKVLRVPGGGSMARSGIDDLTEVAKIHGGKGLAWIKCQDKGFEGVPVDKLGEDIVRQIAKRTEAGPGDLLLFTAGEFETACLALGGVRNEVARRLNLIDGTQFAFCWVTDFPMFERDKENSALAARHHPFTRPLETDINTLESDPLAAKAQAYDIVLNGYEIGGGSIRIHEAQLQEQVFGLMGVSQEQAKERFGHILEAFRYGVPPHGGIAWGFDRLVMVFADEPNIREVIAYPKDQKAKDLMLGAPSKVEGKLLKDLHIQVELEE